MLFCPKCGSILRLKEKSGKKILWCSCGFTTTPEEAQKEKGTKQKEDLEKTEKAPKTRKIDIVEEIETHPKTKAICPKCGNKEAYYWSQQTRGADEPETRFFKCTKCGYTWREYS